MSDRRALFAALLDGTTLVTRIPLFRRREQMCLGVPGKVLEVKGLWATVDFWGVRKQIRLDIVDEPVGPGDFILNHVGFAIRRIPDAEIGETLSLYERLLRETGDDMMAADVRSEIQASVESPPGKES